MRTATEVADEIFACGQANGRDDSAWREVRAIVVADRLALVERLREYAKRVEEALPPKVVTYRFGTETGRVAQESTSTIVETLRCAADELEQEVRAAAEGEE